MKNKEEYSALVIAGQWNSAIFSPDWVSKFLLPDTKLSVEIPIGVIGSLRFSSSEMRLFVLDGKLNFVNLTNTDATFSKLVDIAYSVANYLPHTPVTAFGINFVFECDETDKISSLFSFGDEEILCSNGDMIIGSQIKRSLSNDNYTLNILITKSKETFTVDLNYHYVIHSLTEFKDKFEPNLFFRLKENTLSLLSTLYDLKLE
jgi:hypothetical protein